MKSSDFIIHSPEKLDRLLTECCERVLDLQKRDPEYWGMVGSCVLDMNNHVVFGVNHSVGGGKRDHAEVVAIKNYIKRYGNPPQGGIIITTLSPCSEDIDQPNHRNCTEYINSLPIKKVYCGYMDPSQRDSEVYRRKRFHLRETHNIRLRELCQRFAGTFL